MQYLPRIPVILALVAAMASASAAFAQSSSLFLKEAEIAPAPAVDSDGNRVELSKPIAMYSLMAPQKPEPRKFHLHDLVTIIVRESTSSDSTGSLETDKSTDISGEISEFPQLNITDLLRAQLKQNALEGKEPKVELNFEKGFEGDGEYRRKDSFTTRLQARIIDIKPNGTLVVEARKFIQSDDESLEMILTGMCRREDITTDNTVLSTQLYDLHLVKNHDGEIRKSTKKGLFTKILEGLFAF